MHIALLNTRVAVNAVDDLRRTALHLCAMFDLVGAAELILANEEWGSIDAQDRCVCLYVYVCVIVYK